MAQNTDKKNGSEFYWLLGCGIAVIIIVLICIAFGKQEDGNIVHKDVSVQSGYGLTLRGYLEGPEKAIEKEESCRLIILMHGLTDSGEFDLIRKQADVYTAAGYAVLAIDFDGHGKSDGELVDMTISKELQDAEAILSYAQTLPFVSETILIGHSQGGAVASVLAARHSEEIDRLVLLAPGGSQHERLRSGWFFGTEFDPENPPEKLPAFEGYIGRDYLLDAMNLDLFQLAEGYSGHPVLLIGGSEDTLITADILHRYEQIYSAPDLQNQVSLEIIDGAPHDFTGYEEQVAALVLEALKKAAD